MALQSSKTVLRDGEEVIVVRTSDRMLFKRCRRLWGWTSHMKMALSLKEEADYFWFGSAMHYALEDYHGSNWYGHPGKAFLAFVEATRTINTAPPTASELVPIGLGMMCYYADYWLSTRQPLRTLYVKKVPQVEINALIDLGIKDGGKRVVYGLTIDRMVEDADGLLWVVEYKSAKAFRVYHYDTDEQVTAYCWGAQQMYGRPIAGTYYYQFKKDIPSFPRILSNGSISCDARQPTTAALYRKTLLDVFGKLERAPKMNVKFLNELIVEETEDQDRFIRREPVERNQHQIENFRQRVLLELEDILNPDLPLYPNQTKDCAWSCPLQHVCIAMEDGSDYEQTLSSYAKHPTEEDVTWRQHLPKPSLIHLPPEAERYQALMQELQANLHSSPWEPQESPEELFLEELGHR